MLHRELFLSENFPRQRRCESRVEVIRIVKFI